MAAPESDPVRVSELADTLAAVSDLAGSAVFWGSAIRALRPVSLVVLCRRYVHC